MALTTKAQSATDIPPAVGGETEPHSAAPPGLAKKRPPCSTPDVVDVAYLYKLLNMSARRARKCRARGYTVSCGGFKFECYGRGDAKRGTTDARDGLGSWRNPNSPAAGPAAGGPPARGSDHARRDHAANNAKRARNRRSQRTDRSAAWPGKSAGSVSAATAAPAALRAPAPPSRAQIATPPRAQAAAQASSTAPPVLTPISAQCAEVAQVAGASEDVAEVALLEANHDSDAAVAMIFQQREYLCTQSAGKSGNASS